MNDRLNLLLIVLLPDTSLLKKIDAFRAESKCFQLNFTIFFMLFSALKVNIITQLKKIDAFSAQSDTLSVLKVKHFQPNFAIFFTRFFQR
jgi:hypothetical protein